MLLFWDFSLLGEQLVLKICTFKSRMCTETWDLWNQETHDCIKAIVHYVFFLMTPIFHLKILSYYKKEVFIKCVQFCPADIWALQK